MILITDKRCTEYESPGHPESPKRILGSVDLLRSQSELPIQWEEPRVVSTETVLRSHSAEHLERLRRAEGPFDGDTPAPPGILDHALRGVGGALAALAACRRGEVAFSLLRPPGHHASRDRATGFCYLSSQAIAVLEALATGTQRIGILDFDVHHGNGTEAILCGRKGVFFASVHQHPCYPGTGEADVGDNCFNYPVPPMHPRDAYRKVLESALERLLSHDPEMLAISAGFDAYVGDRIARETLEVEDYHWLGERIRKVGLPFFSILEGGYSAQLPELVFAYLKGISPGGG